MERIAESRTMETSSGIFCWLYSVVLGSWHCARARIQAGKTPAQVRRDMQEVIDLAWSEPSAEAAAMQQYRFPAGKPTVEEFLINLSHQI